MTEQLPECFLGEAVAKHIPPVVKDHEELWTSDQCAAYLGIGNTDSFTQYTASLPSFPDRIEIPSTRGKRGQLRWVMIMMLRDLNQYRPG